MATITLKGNEIHTSGKLPSVGSKAPAFTLVKKDLSELASDALDGKVILNIFPSIDTGVCAISVKRFNEAAAKLEGTQILCVSADLPFALGRFCGAEGIEKVETCSSFRSSFAKDFGLEITDGPLKGLCSRAVVVLDENKNVLHAEQVPEITQEPDYDAALSSLG